MKNVYLERLRDERSSINNRSSGLRKVTEVTGTVGNYAEHYNTQAILLAVEAMNNLTDTIQTIHEESTEGSDQA